MDYHSFLLRNRSMCTDTPVFLPSTIHDLMIALNDFYSSSFQLSSPFISIDMHENRGGGECV